MQTTLNKTTVTKVKDVRRQTLLLDADDQVLGRLAVKAAVLLRGKHKPTYEPSADTGDYVIIINADKVKLTGKKENQKVYYRHSGYPGGIKEIPYKRMKDAHPERVVRMAVRGMLPKNSLGRTMLKKLKVYAGDTHPHEAQKPVKISL